jgi:hypothetical protein
LCFSKIDLHTFVSESKLAKHYGSADVARVRPSNAEREKVKNEKSTDIHFGFCVVQCVALQCVGSSQCK